MKLYRLTSEDLPNLEKRLCDISLPGPKEGEILYKETFALVNSTPTILSLSNENLAQRLRSNEFKKGLFFDKKRASTYALLNHLGFKTIFSCAEGLLEELKMSQGELTRLLSIYAPGSLSDAEGRQKGSIDGEFIHHALSSLFSPRGFTADVDIKSDYHTISYGDKPLDLPLEIGKTYIEKIQIGLANFKHIYKRLLGALVFVTELCGVPIDINQQIQEEYSKVSQVDAANIILKGIASLKENVLKTEEGIKKLVALHNSLGYLIKDIPMEEIKNTHKEYEVEGFLGVYRVSGIFYDYVVPHYSLLWPRRDSIGAFKSSLNYSTEIISRKQLSGASDLINLDLKLLEDKTPS